MGDVRRYCRECREMIDYDIDSLHYHEPIRNRCSVCGARCLNHRSLCAGCAAGMNDVQQQDRDLVVKREKRSNDDD